MPIVNGVKEVLTSAGNYPDPWEALDGTEVFSDDFINFSGWTVYSNYDMTTTPTVDTTASIFRAKGANPCIDSTTRTRGLIIMPEHTASSGVSISRNISGVLTASGDWCIMSKACIPRPQTLAANSVLLTMGLSLPASDVLNYNAVEIFSVEADAGAIGIQTQRIDDGAGGDVTEFNTSDPLAFPHEIWSFLVHKSGEGVVYCFYSIDGGKTLSEIGTITKNPSTFTHLYLRPFATKQLSTYQQIELSYVRVYQSLKLR